MQSLILPNIYPNYGCPKQNVFAPSNIVDTGATTRLSKIRKANKSNVTIEQSRNI